MEERTSARNKKLLLVSLRCFFSKQPNEKVAVGRKVERTGGLFTFLSLFFSFSLLSLVTAEDSRRDCFSLFSFGCSSELGAFFIFIGFWNPLLGFSRWVGTGEGWGSDSVKVWVWWVWVRF